MRIKYLLVILALCLNFICLYSVSSAPPVTQVQQLTEGYVIEGTPVDILVIGQDYRYNFFVYNISNGVFPKQEVSCLFYMANSTGDTVVYSPPTKVNGYWSILISGKNFSQVGYYPFGINCNSSTLGGSFMSYFHITTTGEELTEGDSNIAKSAIFFLLIMGISLISLGYVFLRKGIWMKWTGIFFMVVGFIMIYYDLVMINMYMEGITINSGSIEGVFVLLTRFIKIIPYIIALVSAFAIAKLLRGAYKNRNSSDGWDNGKY